VFPSASSRASSACLDNNIRAEGAICGDDGGVGASVDAKSCFQHPLDDVHGLDDISIAEVARQKKMICPSSREQPFLSNHFKAHPGVQTVTFRLVHGYTNLEGELFDVLTDVFEDALKRDQFPFSSFGKSPSHRS